MARGKPAASNAVATTEGARPQSVVRGIEIADEAMLAEMEGVQGVGRSQNPADRGTPLLMIAQKGSKQVNRQKAEFVAGLEVGNIFNNITNEFWDVSTDPLAFVPCFFRSVYNEWTPQDQGGGFHGSHPMDTPLLAEAQAVEGADGNPRGDIFNLSNGHELVLTHEYWGILRDTWDPVIVPMSSSNLGKTGSKKFQGLIGAQKIQTSKGIVVKPSFFTVFGLQTAYTENDSGDWYKYVVNTIGPNEDANLRAACKELALQCLRGEMKAANEREGDAGDAEKSAVE
jgi:hypothetical protein